MNAQDQHTEKPLTFTVIGGYLGAGKTTLLNHLLKSTQGLRIAVLVNDFGNVNIDAGLIRSHDGETINLTNGCMCCSLANGFAQAIAEIRGHSDRLDHVVIEPSGVADPAVIAQYGEMFGLSLDGILVVADAERVKAQVADVFIGDSVKQQFKLADLIILNKTDLVDAAQLSDIRGWLSNAAPDTPIIDTCQAQLPASLLLGKYSDHHKAAGNIQPHHDHTTHAHYMTWTIESSTPVTRSAITRFATGLGTGIYRAKGFVFLQEEPTRRFVFQQVGSRWSLEAEEPWHNDTPHTTLIAIGQPEAASVESLTMLLG